MKAESTLKGISMDRWRWIIQGQIEGIERDRITELNARKREDEKRRIEDERRAREDEKRRIEDEKRAQKDKELSQREAALADGEEKLSETRNKLLASVSKLLALGLSPEQISDALSLPIDDVHNLRLSAET